MRKNYQFLFLMGAMLIIANMLFGAYLKFQPIQVKQPDGSALDIFASGDEYYNWLHDKDGYTIKQNDQGWYVYLNKDSKGDLAFTSLIAERDNPNTEFIAPWTNISPEEMGQKRTERKERTRDIPSANARTTGTLNNLVVFIRFSDQTEFGQNFSTYNGWFNGTTGNTMQSYFKEASYNQLDIPTTFYPTQTTTVVSWQDSHIRGYFSPYNATSNPTGYTSDSQATTREHTLLQAAVNGIASLVPVGLNLDSDNDGKVDNVCFIIKGNSDGWSDLLWPHMWSLYSVTANINGKRVYTYNFQLSDFMASSGVGVLCHEMFHSLGAPDLYHYTSDGNTPVGGWDIMENDANPPQHMSAFMKFKYGEWITSIPVISTSGTYTLNPLTSSTSQCYRINSPNSSTQYFVVEFRKKTGTFENSVPGSGMIIYRINTLAGDGNADGPPDEVYAYRLNGTTTTNGTINSANFSTETGRTSFTSSTNPSCFLVNGSSGGINITNISSSAGSTMTFYYGLSPIPSNLTGTVGNATVTLNWTAPLSGNQTGYKVYRNSSYLATVTNPTYTDNSVINGTSYTYYVTATYSSAPTESGASNTVTLTPSSNPLITIGTGTSILRQPFGMYWGYERDAALYLNSEIGTTGTIQSLNWYVGTAQSSSAPVTIRMKSISGTSLTADTWANMISGATTVYTTSSLSFSTTGWKTITLTAPFVYSTGNLLVLIETNYGGTGTSSYPYFTYTAAGTGTHQYWATDNTAPTGNGTVNTNRPNLQIQMSTPQGVPTVYVNPTSIAFGNVYIGNAPTVNFTVSNTGTGTLNGSVVTTTGYTLATARNEVERQASSAYPDLRTTLSFSLTSGQSQNYALTFTPVAAQNYNSNVTITSNDTTTPTTYIALTGVGVTPVVNAPTGLLATAGNTIVSLSWTAPTGSSGTISGYKIFRNSSLITPTPITLTNYDDNGLTNGTNYQYYVTAVYTNPTGESAASASASATPSGTLPISIIIGYGTTTGQELPVEPYYGYTYSQSVYLQSEINISSCDITKVSYYYNGYSAWNDEIQIYMGHTASTSFASTTSWIPLTELSPVYSGNLGVSTTAGWVELTLNTPFSYNNSQNLVIAVDENTSGYHSNSDEFYCSSVTGNRSINYRSDLTNPNPGSPPTGTLRAYVPNIKLGFTSGPVFDLNTTSLAYGNVFTGSTATQNFTITNNGGTTLTGEITTPVGFSIALSARSATDEIYSRQKSDSRNTLSYSIEAGQNKVFTLTFAPTSAMSYDNSVSITSNDIAHSTNSLTLTATGVLPPPVFNMSPSSLAYGSVYVGLSSTKSFTISNTGGSNLTGQIISPGGYSVAEAVRSGSDSERIHSQAELRNSIAYSIGAYSNKVYNLTFTPSYSQSYNSNVLISSNDTTHPTNLLALTGIGVVPTFNPPISLAAAAFHATVNLTWSAPNSGVGTLSGYKVYRNSALITPTPIIATSYSDSGLTDGLEYRYYVKAVYTDPAGESTANNVVYATPVALAPLNLTGIIDIDTNTLFWQAPANGIPTGYNIYRDSELLTFVTDLSYTDDNIENGIDYVYHVTAMYSNPVAESDSSNSILLSPELNALITIGDGIESDIGLPIEPSFGYTYSQSIYLKSELNYANRTITKIYWDYSGGSAFSDSIKIYMGHTDLSDFPTETSWINANTLTMVYDGYISTTTSAGWIEIILTTPFAYDCTHNLVIAVDENTSGWHLNSDDFYSTNAGTNRSIVYGSNTINPDPVSPPANGTHLFTRAYIPNTKLFLIDPNQPQINTVQDSLIFSGVAIGDSSQMTLSIVNAGGQILTGTISTPAGFTVSMDSGQPTRNSINYSIESGQSANFNITFTPSLIQAYDGYVSITSNDIITPTKLIPLSGFGYIPAALSLSDDTITENLIMNQTSNRVFIMQNTGGQALNYSIQVSETLDRDVEWLTCSSANGTIETGESFPIELDFLTANTTPGLHQASVTITSNDPIHPSMTVFVSLNIALAVPVVQIIERIGGPRITWEAIPGANMYHIYYCDTTNGNFSYLTTTTQEYYDCDTNHIQRWYKVISVFE